LEGDNGETSRAIKSLLDSNPYCDLEHIWFHAERKKHNSAQ
jgi:hypothetical protein